MDISLLVEILTITTGHNNKPNDSAKRSPPKFDKLFIQVSRVRRVVSMVFIANAFTFIPKKRLIPVTISHLYVRSIG